MGNDGRIIVLLENILTEYIYKKNFCMYLYTNQKSCTNNEKLGLVHWHGHYYLLLLVVID